MEKFIGCLIIIIGTTLMGFKYADKIKQRYVYLMYASKVLIMLRGEIDYNESAINEIFRELHKKTRGNYKEFFLQLYEETKENYQQTISEYWSDAVDKHLINMSYTVDDISKIKELGENLGYLDKKMQLKNIDFTLDYLEKEAKELSETMDKNMKMYRMFGALAGVFIAIVLC